MSVQPKHTGSENTPTPVIGDLATWCPLSCTIESVQCTAGEVIVLRVAGEVDLSTVPILHAALDEGLAQDPAHLVVDLAQIPSAPCGDLTCSPRPTATLPRKHLDMQSSACQVTSSASGPSAGVMPLFPVVTTAPQRPSPQSGLPSPTGRSADQGKRLTTCPYRTWRDSVCRPGPLRPNARRACDDQYQLAPSRARGSPRRVVGGTS
jgi:hypothetical protein